MSTFVYTCIDASGSRVTGRITASSLQDAERQLMQSDMVVLRIRKSWFGVDLMSRRVSEDDLIHLTYQLAQLLKAGVSLVDIIDDIVLTTERESPLFTVMQRVSDDMRHGKAFHEALGQFPDVFDVVYIGLVASGERSAQLSFVLDELHQRLLWVQTLKSKVYKVMLYPLLVLSVVLCVFVFLMIYLVPQLVGFMNDMGQEVGWATQSLLLTSGFLVDNWLWMLISVFMVSLMFGYLYRSIVGFRLWLHKAVLSFGIIGRILYQLELVRLTSVMGLMYASGLNLHEMMSLSVRVMRNQYLANKVLDVESKVMSGASLSEAFKDSGIFPNLVVKLIKVGESGGKMDDSMRHISRYYDREVNDLIEKIEPMVEPLITLVLGLLLGWIMLASVAPIYDVLGKLS